MSRSQTTNRVVREFGALFADNPVIRWSGAALLRWSDVDVVVKVSPASKDDIEPSATLITIRSPAYNIVSETVQQEWASPVRFISDDGALVVRKDRSPILGIGALQRVVRTATGQVAFYVARTVSGWNGGRSAAPDAGLEDLYGNDGSVKSNKVISSMSKCDHLTLTASVVWSVQSSVTASRC